MFSAEALPQACQTLEESMKRGVSVGAQVYVSLSGKVVADFAMGEGRADVPMTTDTLMCWFSSSKQVVAVAIGQLWEQGKLDVDHRLARYIPEFGTKGKEIITIGNILSHTGGFHSPDDSSLTTGKYAGLEGRLPWDKVVARICDAGIQPGWTVGRTAGYQGYTGYYILAELVRRLDGRPYEKYVRDEIFEPLGMNDCWIGMPGEQFDAYGHRIGHQLNTTDPREDVPISFSDTREGVTECQPGAGGRGPMNQLGRLHEMLLGRGERQGKRLLSSVTVDALTARHRAGTHDTFFAMTVDWGLGFAIQTSDTGRHSSPRAFGHGGGRSVISFADPEHELVVAAVFNGKADTKPHYERIDALSTAVYEDLRIVPRGTPGEVKQYPRGAVPR